MKGGWSGVRTSHSLSYQPDICLRVTAFAPPALRPLRLRRSGRYASGAQAVTPPALRPLCLRRSGRYASGAQAVTPQ